MRFDQADRDPEHGIAFDEQLVPPKQVMQAMAPHSRTPRDRRDFLGPFSSNPTWTVLPSGTTRVLPGVRSQVVRSALLSAQLPALTRGPTQIIHEIPPVGPAKRGLHVQAHLQTERVRLGNSDSSHPAPEGLREYTGCGPDAASSLRCLTQATAGSATPASAWRISCSWAGEVCGIGALGKPPSRPWSLSAVLTLAGRFG